MGSIPVAGAKRGESRSDSPLLAPAQRTHPRASREIGFAYPVRRSTSSLVRRRTRVYSPTAKFPLRLSLFDIPTKTFSSRTARDWVRILRAKRPELAQGSCEQKYSPTAKFPSRLSPFAILTKTFSSRIARDWVRILRAKRPELARGSCEQKYSPTANFSLGVPSTLSRCAFFFTFSLFLHNIFTFPR